MHVLAPISPPPKSQFRIALLTIYNLENYLKMATSSTMKNPATGGKACTDFLVPVHRSAPTRAGRQTGGGMGEGRMETGKGC